MVRQAVPLQPVDVDGGADIHSQPIKDPALEQVDAPEGGCDPMGSPHWSRLLAGPVALWREEPMPEQVYIWTVTEKDVNLISVATVHLQIGTLRNIVIGKN
ncbi:AN1-type zinc finger protein 5-like [Grus japonensis]|uniref:AN1-type zinc finger protein 5-like n=1 Tax=Grus japonensis TaxID=30415 RepID=A0ABC9WEW0_GRUJA